MGSGQRAYAFGRCAKGPAGANTDLHRLFRFWHGRRRRVGVIREACSNLCIDGRCALHLEGL